MAHRPPQYLWAANQLLDICLTVANVPDQVKGTFCLLRLHVEQYTNNIKRLHVSFRILIKLNNRAPLSKALSCDRLPEEIWCSQQILVCLYEVWTPNFRGNLSHIGPKTEGLYCFYCTTLNFERKIAKTGHYALIGAGLRRDTIASRDRFGPMGARQNLALYYLNSSSLLHCILVNNNCEMCLSIMEINNFNVKITMLKKVFCWVTLM